MMIDWPGVIDDPFAVFASDDHRMILRVVFEQAIKDEVAGTGAVEIAAEEVGIVGEEGFGVGELGECRVGEIGGKIRAWAGAEEGFGEWGIGVGPLLDRGEGGHLAGLELSVPAVVVEAEGFTIGVAEEGGAVDEFGRKVGGGSVGGLLGEGGEPVAEGLAVEGGVETKPVGRTVGKGVGGVGGESDG